MWNARHTECSLAISARRCISISSGTGPGNIGVGANIVLVMLGDRLGIFMDERVRAGNQLCGYRSFKVFTHSMSSSL